MGRLSADAASSLLLPVRVVELDRGDLDPGAWDEFAKACGASFLCCNDSLKLEALAGGRPFNLRRFEIRRVEDDRKIGQCAIALDRKSVLCLDSMQLLPEFSACWERAIVELLAMAGPGRYRYGSRWSTEVSRGDQIQGLEGVVIESIEDFVLQGIEFARWPDWQSYLHDVSRNIIRNVNKAARTYPEIAIRRRGGISGTAGYPLAV